MSFELTANAEIAASQTSLTPILAIEIEGVPTIYGSNLISKIFEFGDEGEDFGEGRVFGERVSVTQQETLINMGQGTTTRISQQINSDRLIGDSISNMTINLIDKDNEVTNLISPSKVVTELLGRRCKVYLGFENTDFKDDYIVIMRANIESISSGSGHVKLKLNHPDDKRRSMLFKRAESQLNGSLTAGSTVITVDDATDFLATVTGPDGSTTDADFETLVRINDEIIKYEVKTGTQFQTLTRGYLGTTAASHSDNDPVTSYYRIEGNAIELALKLMLSGKEGAFEEDIEIENFVRVSDTETVSNSIFFNNLNVITEYNLQVGDYITTTGASNGANNVSNKAISGVVATEGGSYITVSGVSFVEENDTAAVVDFRSQYDVWPDGAGLKMHNDEVDIDQFTTKKGQFYTSTDMDFYIDDTMENAKEFIGQQILQPIGAYNIPRKSQASMGAHFPPLPTETIKILNSTNVKHPDKLVIERGLNKNFTNAVVYKFDYDALDTSKSLGGYVNVDGVSKARYGDNVPEKAFIIEAKGLRTSNGGVNEATSATTRRLNKYKFAAEQVKINTNFKTGYPIEIGDIVLLEISDLKLSDISSGTRDGESRLFEVQNKTLDIKTGDVELTLLDSSFDKSTRYALISMASFIKSGSDAQTFVIEESFNSPYGINEFKKWENYIGASVVVRSTDYATSDTGLIASITSNTIVLDSNLTFTPSAGYLMELDIYDNQPENIKLIYGFMVDDPPSFADGGIQYQMI